MVADAVVEVFRNHALDAARRTDLRGPGLEAARVQFLHTADPEDARELELALATCLVDYTQEVRVLAAELAAYALLVRHGDPGPCGAQTAARILDGGAALDPAVRVALSLYCDGWLYRRAVEAAELLA